MRSITSARKRILRATTPNSSTSPKISPDSSARCGAATRNARIRSKTRPAASRAAAFRLRASRSATPASAAANRRSTSSSGAGSTEPADRTDHDFPPPRMPCAAGEVIGADLCVCPSISSGGYDTLKGLSDMKHPSETTGGRRQTDPPNQNGG